MTYENHNVIASCVSGLFENDLPIRLKTKYSPSVCSCSSDFYCNAAINEITSPTRFFARHKIQTSKK